MASTPDQQYLTDTKTLGNPEQCCMTLGGYVEIDDEGTPMCVIYNSQSSNTPEGSFYLSDACGYIEEVVEDESSNGLTWNQTLFDDLIGSAGDIWNIFKPTPPIPPPSTGGGGNGGGGSPPPPAPASNMATYAMVGGGVLILVLAVVLLVRKK